MDKIKILFLAANPVDTPLLDLDEEVQAITKELNKEGIKDKFVFVEKRAVKTDDVSTYFLEEKPDIVHFSGHGSRASQIYLLDEKGKSVPLEAKVLGMLFKALKENIRCVVLNACFAEVQALVISKYIDCVIGMTRAIGDKAAIKFAQGFYRGLGNGTDVKTAFDLGCFQIGTHFPDEHTIPQIMWKNDEPKKILFFQNGEPKSELPVVEPTTPKKMVVGTIEPPPGRPKNRVHLTAVIITICIIIGILLIVGLSLNGFSPNLKPIDEPTNNTTTVPSQTVTPVPLSDRAISPENAANVSQIGSLNSGQSNQVIWSPDGKWLALASSDIEIYDGETLEQVYTINPSPSNIAFSPDSRFLIAAGSGLYAWNMDGWGQIVAKPDAGYIQSVAISPDGKTIATAHEKAVKLWDIASWNVTHTLPAGSVTIVAFSPDGNTLAAGGGMAGTEIKLWDIESGQELNTLTGHTNWIKSIAFSPDGKILASGSVDEKIWLWNMDSGLQLRVLNGHTDQVTGVAFSPDGQLLASVSWDLTVRLWKVENGQELNTLTGHTNWIKSITFSPDGATFASGGYDQEVLLWGLPS